MKGSQGFRNQGKVVSGGRAREWTGREGRGGHSSASAKLEFSEARGRHARSTEDRGPR